MHKQAFAPLLLICGLMLPTFGSATLQTLDRIVAVVNEDVITQLELDNEMAFTLRELRERGTIPSDRVALTKQVLNQMILSRIQLQLAAQRHIQVDDEALNRHLEGLAQQNGMTLMQLSAAMRTDGVDYAQFRERRRDEITVMQLQQRLVRQGISITDQEIKNFMTNEQVQGTSLDEYHMGHILVVIPEAASPEVIQKAKQDAESLVERLRKGEDFEQLAINYSGGQHALEGGDLGWRKLGQIPSLFVDRINLMKKGEVSDPIRSPSGFHIIKLMDRRQDIPKQIVKQTRVRHILIKPNEVLSSEAAKNRLLQLRQRIQAGEDFASLAIAHSEDIMSGREGGSLGWVNPGSMVEPFETAMDKLKLNELSEPVETRFGWHLIQVLERRDYDNTDTALEMRARNLIGERKFQPALQDWLRRIRDEAFVEVRL